MKFGTLAIHNFLTIGDAVINLRDRGLNVIQGKNLDDSSASSNGSGKSSIVDALCWALYGVTARGAKGDAVINRHMGKGCTVRLSIHHGDTVYQVSRYRKDREFKNSVRVCTWTDIAPGRTVEVMDLTKGTDAETQKVIEKILGCSYEVFVAAVYAGQEVMPDLPRMGDRDLKRLIEEASGLQRIERAYQIARERFNETQAKVTGATTHSLDLNAEVEKLTRRRDSVILQSKEWQDSREARILAARTKAAGAEGAYATREATVAGVRAKLPAVRERADQLKASLADHRKLEAAWSAVSARAGAADRAINRHALAAVAQKIKDIQAKIASASDHLGKPCRECGKPHTEADMEVFVAAQRDQLGQAHTEAAALKVKVQEQITAAQALAAEAEAARKLIPDVTAVNEELQKLMEFERMLAGYEREVQTLKAAAQAEAAAVLVVTAEVNPHSAVLAHIESELAEKVKTQTDAHLKLAELQKELEVAKAVVKTFGPSGVRAQILDTVTPYLNTRTADYLSVLSDGNLTAVWTTLTKDSKGDLKEKFSIDVSNKTGAESFTGLSGGEKRKVRLATALALQDLVASRASLPIECWIGDEIDDALDPSGLERLMTILERKARERGTVLVISHNSLTDWCDNVTTVSKSGGASTVRGSLTEF